MGLIDNLRKGIIDWLTGGMTKSAYKERVDYIMDRREYRLGIQKRFIKTRPFQADDNLVMNFTGLVVDRGVSMLFGESVKFDYGEDEATQEYIDGVWRANRKDILLHKIALSGAEAGHYFVKILPDENGIRLVNLDPAFMDIETDPDDVDNVTKYIIQYKVVVDNKTVAKKEVTEHNGGNWLITNYEADMSGKWVQTDQQVWDYPFPPIVDGQNLPNIGNAWGVPDITNDTIELQDRTNFVASNMSKIIRLYAHPKTWGRGINAADKIEMGPDDMVNLGSQGELGQLPPVADMTGSANFLTMLRQSLFDITRTVDITSIVDKIGALTNFGLRVLYNDALDKLQTKRLMYGEFLKEVNRRILILSGMEPVECELVWNDPLPTNELEEAQMITSDLSAGIVDKQTASELRGYNWATVEERLGQEKTNAADIGAGLLAAFDRNGGFGNPAI